MTAAEYNRNHFLILEFNNQNKICPSITLRLLKNAMVPSVTETENMKKNKKKVQLSEKNDAVCIIIDLN